VGLPGQPSAFSDHFRFQRRDFHPLIAFSDYRVRVPTVDKHARQRAAQLLLPLRQCVLAVSVLSDLDVVPSEAGVLLPGPAGMLVRWSEIEQAIGTFPADGAVARRRVETLLRLHRFVLELGQDAAEEFHSAARVLALPPGHADHPGPGWARETLRGNVLELGIGVQGLIGDLDRVVALSAAVLEPLGVTPADWWPALREHAERMGSLSATRLARDGVTGLIRPVGGCDVLALLSSRALRQYLAGSDGVGMRALAVPTRRRGWFDVRRVDPGFVRAAWSLTEESERGLPVPLLVTADAVSLPFALA